MKRQTMICVGVMVPEDYPLSDIVQGELRHAAGQIAAKHADCEYDTRVALIPLGDEGTNAKLCERCGKWATDYDKPDPVAPLVHGTYVKGRFLCAHCPPYVRRAADEPNL